MAGYARQKPLKPKNLFTSFNDAANDMGGPMSGVASNAHERIEGATRRRLAANMAGSKAAGREHSRREASKRSYNPIFRRDRETIPSMKHAFKVALLDNEVLETKSRSSRQTG